MDGSKDEGKKPNCVPEKRLPSVIGKHAVRLMIGSNLLSVGVKWYLISRMASKARSYFDYSCLCHSSKGLRAAILNSLIAKLQFAAVRVHYS